MQQADRRPPAAPPLAEPARHTACVGPPTPSNVLRWGRREWAPNRPESVKARCHGRWAHHDSHGRAARARGLSSGKGALCSRRPLKGPTTCSKWDTKVSGAGYRGPKSHGRLCPRLPTGCLLLAVAGDRRVTGVGRPTPTPHVQLRHASPRREGAWACALPRLEPCGPVSTPRPWFAPEGMNGHRPRAQRMCTEAGAASASRRAQSCGLGSTRGTMGAGGPPGQ